MAGSSIWAPIGEQGPPGPQGPIGPVGPQGPAGPGLDLFISDLANAINPALGANLVGYRGRTVHARLDDYMDAADYGIVGNGIADDWAAINAFLDLAYAQKKVAKFPGWMVCAHSQELNLFRGSNFHIVGDGFPTFKYTGIIAGNGVSIDAGVATNAYGIVFRDFNIEGNFVCTDAWYTRGIHHSDLVNIRAWGGSAVPMRIVFAVCNNYSNIRLTSVGARVGAPTGTPTEGLRLEHRGAGEYVAWCKFDNLIVENVANTGIRVLDSTGCVFLGGTSEGNGRGMLLEEPCRNNKVVNMDFEANGTSGDIVVNGHMNSFDGVQCLSTASSTNVSVQVAVGTGFTNSYLRAAELQSSSSNSLLTNCEFSDNVALGITGIGSHKRVGCYKTNNSGVVTSRYKDILGASGAFTPSLAGSTTAGSHTYTVRTGKYEVIAGRCFFDMTIALSVKDGAMAGVATISGMPFAAEGTANISASGAVGTWGNVTAPTAGYTNVNWRIDPSSSSIILLATGFGVALTTINASSINATSNFTITGSYPIT